MECFHIYFVNAKDLTYINGYSHLKLKVENHKVCSRFYFPPASVCIVVLSFLCFKFVFFWCTGQLPLLPGFDYVTSSSPTFELDSSSLSDISLAPNWQSMQAFSPTRDSLITKDHCYGAYREGYTSAPSSSLGSVLTNGSLANDDIYSSEMATWQGNEYFPSPSNQSTDFVSSYLGFHVPKNRRPGARWFKLRAALKWGISIRKEVAAKRMAKLLYYDF